MSVRGPKQRVTERSLLVKLGAFGLSAWLVGCGSESESTNAADPSNTGTGATSNVGAAGSGSEQPSTRPEGAGNGEAGGSASSGTASGGSDAQAGAGGSSGGATTAGGNGSGVSAGTGGGAAAGADARPPCLSQASDAVLIGDSYITGFLSPALQPALAELYATAANFRNYAVAGTSAASGGIGLIAPQIDSAITANPKIELVLMSGGGNDVLLCDTSKYPGCDSACNRAGSSKNEVCTDIVDTALSGFTQMATKLASAGVKDLVYFFYPHIPANNGGYKEILDYGTVLAKTKCDDIHAATAGKLTCHYINLIEPFAAAGGDINAANFSALDGIHPSAEGQRITATQIWDKMQSQCLGMPNSKGCCAP